MVERTRAHERLVPETRSDPDPIDLVVHFHGAEWLAEQSVARLGDGRVSAVVNLGAGSGSYDRAFADPAAFDSLLAGVVREVGGALRRPRSHPGDPA